MEAAAVASVSAPDGTTGVLISLMLLFLAAVDSLLVVSGRFVKVAVASVTSAAMSTGEHRTSRSAWAPPRSAFSTARCSP